MREVSRNSPRGSLGSFPLQEDPAETWCASITQTGGITSRFYEISPAEGQNRPMHCSMRYLNGGPDVRILQPRCAYNTHTGFFGPPPLLILLNYFVPPGVRRFSYTFFPFCQNDPPHIYSNLAVQYFTLNKSHQG